MKEITNYKEFNEINSAPSLLDALNEACHKEKEKILKYMRSFPEDVVCPSRVYDYIKKTYIPTTIIYYTDGEYIWDEREIYYFEHYNIKLADSFISKILAV